MKINFKKLTCLGLALVTTLSLAACGGNEGKTSENTEPAKTPNNVSTTQPAATQPTTQPTSAPTEAEQVVSMLTGTWRTVLINANSPDESFVIHENGDITNTRGRYVALKNVKTTDFGSYYQYTLYYENDDYYVFYSLYDDPFCCRDSYFNNNIYYREADYANYDIVSITPENILDYMEFHTEITVEHDAYGDPSEVDVSYRLDFKEGLGGPSTLYGEVEWTFDVKNVTIHENCEYTIGNTVFTDEDAAIVMFTPNGSRLHGFGFISKMYFIDDYTPNEVLKIPFMRLTGADKVLGKVYVPKGWNS